VIIRHNVKNIWFAHIEFLSHFSGATHQYKISKTVG